MGIPEMIQRQTEMAMVCPSSALRRSCPRLNRFLELCRRNGRLASSEDGGSMIEFALVSTAMMSFVMVVMQLCLAFYSFGMITDCAREATRWAITRGSTCQTSALASCTTTTTAISNYAKGLGYPNIGGGTMTVTTTFPDTYNSVANCETPSVCRVMVTITYSVPIKLPLVPKNAISLSTASQMYFVQ
jgi:Flp pilus assembly protein TadG